MVDRVQGGRVGSWLAGRRRAMHMRVAPIPWGANREWRLDDGVLRHRTDGFFTLRGVRVRAPGLAFDGLELPMIDQPEIGLLAFLVHRDEAGGRWLLQAKSEPGNQGFTQVGPSVQATQSNYKRLHGGAPTRFLGHFLAEGVALRADVRQSEQGSRFIGKFNRNAVRVLDEPLPPEHPDWAWFDCEAIQDALLSDYAINTDSRSVIVSADWDLIAPDGVPFNPVRACSVTDRDRFGTDVETLRRGLWESSQCSPDVAHPLERLRDASRTLDIELEAVALDALEGWSMGCDRLAPRDGKGDFDVVSVAVEADHRECSSWHQPMLRGLVPQTAVLLLCAREGEVEIFLRDSREPGFRGSVQYGPSWQSDGLCPCWVARVLSAARPVVSLLQTDEGGRFMRSVVRYEIRTVAPERLRQDADGGTWVNVAQLRALCHQSGALTNEARTLVSMLLALA